MNMNINLDQQVTQGPNLQVSSNIFLFFAKSDQNQPCILFSGLPEWAKVSYFNQQTREKVFQINIQSRSQFL